MSNIDKKWLLTYVVIGIFAIGVILELFNGHIVSAVIDGGIVLIITLALIGRFKKRM